MGILTAFSNACSAIAGFFGWSRDRGAANNTPEMQANAKAKTDAAIKKQAEDAVASGDVDKVRKDAAE